MAIDSDLSALLPDPPPPRPARRDAAIEEAMRRFDGGGAHTPRPAAEVPPKPAREIWRRPQLAVLASAALVMLVGVPVWLAQKDSIVARGPQAPGAAVQAEPRAADAPGSEEETAEQAAAASPAAATEAEGLAQALPMPAAPAPVENAMAPPPTVTGRMQDEAQAPAKAAPIVAQAAAPRSRRAAAPSDEDKSIVVTGSRISRPDYESTSAITTVAEELLTSRGDWNICTMYDPRRDADACRAFADPSAAGGLGRAGRQLADGVRLVWQGRLDPAIDAFDSAIGAKPDLSIAYVNRGLAYQAKGDLRRALADFDRVVAREPGNARGYYYRSLLRRAQGNEKRAEADARRAVELDPRYEDVLP
jgi:tetratricopeptide (TPR) repeat protein